MRSAECLRVRDSWFSFVFAGFSGEYYLNEFYLEAAENNPSYTLDTKLHWKWYNMANKKIN